MEETPPEPTEREPTTSRMSKRAGSVRSADSGDSGSHKKSPQKSSRKKSSLKTSPSPSQLTTTTEEPAPVLVKTKPTGPVKYVSIATVLRPSKVLYFMMHYTIRTLQIG